MRTASVTERWKSGKASRVPATPRASTATSVTRLRWRVIRSTSSRSPAPRARATYLVAAIAVALGTSRLASIASAMLALTTPRTARPSALPMTTLYRKRTTPWTRMPPVDSAAWLAMPWSAASRVGGAQGRK